MREFLRKYKHLFCMAGIVCAVLLVFGAVRVFALPGLSLKVQTTKLNTVTDAVTPALQSGESIAQSFTTDRALYTAAVLPDLRGCKSGAQLHGVITDHTGATLARAQASAPYTDAAEPPYVSLVFDTPLQSGAPRTLTLTITVQPQDSDDTVRFYKSTEVQAQTGMSVLRTNGNESTGSLTMQMQTGDVRAFITPFFIVLALLCAGALCAVYAAVCVARWPLRNIYLVAVICFGLLYLFVLPPYGSTDEAQHISQAYNNSSRVLGVTPQYVPWGKSYRRACDVNSVLEENATTVFSYQELARGLFSFTAEPATSVAIYEKEEVGGYQIPYVLSTLGVLLGRLLHFGYVPTLLLGRLLNLALFVALSYLAVKHAPFGNAVFAAVGLLPSTLHVAASFSRDSFTLALAFLFTALILRAAQQAQPLHWAEAIALAMLCILVAPSKAAYVPLVLLLLLVPSTRFAKTWQAWAYRAATAGASALLYWRANSTIVWDAAMKSTENYARTAAENPDAITYSLSYILTHVWQTLGLLVNTVVQSSAHYFNGLVGGTLGNDNLALSWIFVVALFVLLVLATQCGASSDMLRPRSWRTAVPAWLSVVGCCGLVLLGCVLWTPTYYETIYGLQGRYFLPMLPLLLLLCTPCAKKDARVAAQETIPCQRSTQSPDTPACKLLLACACVQVGVLLNVFYVVAQR